MPISAMYSLTWHSYFCTVLTVLSGAGATAGEPRASNAIQDAARPIITLAADGFPDYEARYYDWRRADVTPENNAGVLLIRAMWPADIAPSDRPLVLGAMGVASPPSGLNRLEPLTSDATQKQLADWLGVGVEQFDRILLAIDLAKETPWTAEDAPPLAAWVAKHAPSIELIAQASRRPKFFVPEPSSLNHQRNDILGQLLELQLCRRAADALALRAMNRLGEGDPAGAWDDVLACYGIGAFLAQGGTLLHQLGAGGIVNQNHARAVTVLHHGGIDRVEAEAHLRDLQRLTPPRLSHDVYAHGERLYCLNSLAQLATGAEDTLIRSEYKRRGVEFGDDLDWKRLIAACDQFMDRLQAATASDNLAERSERLIELGGELATPATQVAGKDLTDLVATQLARENLEGATQALGYDARGQVEHDLAIVAAALAVYRARHDAYPAHLEQLAPTVLEELPSDAFATEAFRYRRSEDDGFTLYSVGPDRQDDGGDNLRGTVVNGDWIRIDASPEEPSSWDLIHRVPRPSLRGASTGTH